MTQYDEFATIWREDLGSFIHRSFLELRPGETYLPNWHVWALAHALAQCESGAVKRLIITIPPRTLKSVSVSVAFTAWLLGRQAHRKIMCISYGEKLANKHSNDTRQLMTSDFYQRAFGDVLAPRRHSLDRVTTTLNGYREAYSITGDIRGSGADFIIIDDPLKGIEMQSTAERVRVNGLFDSVISNRLNNKNEGCIIIVMQRIHLDDLVGHLLETGDWVHLNIPATASEPMIYPIGRGDYHHRQPGDVIQPERESFEQLMQMKRQMGSYNYAAQYDQNPIPLEGNIFRREWFRYYDLLPRRFERVVQSWDTAHQIGGSNDFSVCTTWGVTGQDCYLLDVIRERLEYPDLKRRIVAAADQYRPFAIVIEAAGAGISVKQDLRRETRHRLIGFRPKLNKQLRAHAASATAEAGEILLPHSAPWLDEFLAELTAFPSGRHDDQVDSMSQFIRWNLRWPKPRTERPDHTRPEGLPLHPVGPRSRPVGRKRR